MKNDSFKSSILKYLQPRTPIDAEFMNLQDDNPIVILGPMIEELDESSHLSTYLSTSMTRSVTIVFLTQENPIT